MLHGRPRSVGSSARARGGAGVAEAHEARERARGRGGGAVGECSWWGKGGLRAGKDGKGEELFCVGAGGMGVGGPETSHGTSGGFGPALVMA